MDLILQDVAIKRLNVLESQLEPLDPIRELRGFRSDKQTFDHYYENLQTKQKHIKDRIVREVSVMKNNGISHFEFEYMG